MTPPSDPIPAGTPPHQPAGYPVVLAVSGWHCLVVGGGPVAVRRARALLAAGASVTVVAPTPIPDLSDLPDLEVEQRPYRRGEAARYALVLTATGDHAVDRAVVGDAGASGVLVNSADADPAGTVHLPAVYRRGPVTVAVSTEGASPALAAWIRTRVAAAIPDGVEELAALLDEARARLQAEGRPTDSIDWGALLDGPLVGLVEQGRVDEAREQLRHL